MKHLIVLAVLLLASPCYAFNPMVVGGGVPAGGGASYLLTETFDGATDCGDASHTNCDNTWNGVGSGTLDYNNAAQGNAPLEGTYSLYMSSSSGNLSTYMNHDATTTVGAYFLYEPTVTGGEGFLMIIEDSGGGNLCQLKKTGSEFLRVIDEDSASSDGSSAISVGTTYHFWLEYQTGTGDGICRVYFATSATKPGAAEVGITNGTYTGVAARLNILESLDDTAGIFDNIKVDDAFIGSSP